MDAPFGLTVREAAEKLYAWKAHVEARAGHVFHPDEWLPTIDDLTDAMWARWSWGPNEWAAVTGALDIGGVHTILDGLGFPVPNRLDHSPIGRWITPRRPAPDTGIDR